MVRLAVGGHPLPLLLSADGLRELGEHGPLLGAFSEVSWPEHEVRLPQDSVLLAYTDGITDAQGKAGVRFGFNRLKETLSDLRGSSARELIAGVANALGDFHTGSLSDDTAAIAIRRRPAGEQPEGVQETNEIPRTGTIRGPA